MGAIDRQNKFSLILQKVKTRTTLQINSYLKLLGKENLIFKQIQKANLNKIHS